MSSAAILRDVARSRTEKPSSDDGSRIAWIVALASIVALALGFAAVTWLLAEPDAAEASRYVEFQKLDVQASTGLAVLSFDLKVARDDVGRVVAHKSAIEARFKEAIAQLDLGTLYSRRGKEKLARQLSAIANEELGADIVEGVYFGNFKVYSRDAPR